MEEYTSDRLSCPECGYDDFDEESIGGRVECPGCGEVTDEEIGPSGFAPSSGAEDIEVSWGETEVSADDAEEVTEDGIQFVREESYYMAGEEEFTCPDCGSECDVSCGDFQLKDVAYCENCDYEFTRSRTGLVDDVSDWLVVEQRAEDRDVYEEYKCDHCGEMHPYTKPDGEFERPHGSVGSLESVNIGCPCGSTVNFNRVEPGDVRECNSCGRSYSLQME